MILSLVAFPLLFHLDGEALLLSLLSHLNNGQIKSISAEFSRRMSLSTSFFSFLARLLSQSAPSFSSEWPLLLLFLRDFLSEHPSESLVYFPSLLTFTEGLTSLQPFSFDGQRIDKNVLPAFLLLTSRIAIELAETSTEFASSQSFQRFLQQFAVASYAFVVDTMRILRSLYAEQREQIVNADAYRLIHTLLQLFQIIAGFSIDDSFRFFAQSGLIALLLEVGFPPTLRSRFSTRIRLRWIWLWTPAFSFLFSACE